MVRYSVAGKVWAMAATPRVRLFNRQDSKKHGAGWLVVWFKYGELNERYHRTLSEAEETILYWNEFGEDVPEGHQLAVPN